MSMSPESFQDQSIPRKVQTTPTRKYFLIYTNGAVTEKSYFEDLKQHLPKGMLTVDIVHNDASPRKLSRKALRYESISSIKHDEIWVIFDKDSFDDFNEAVKFLETQPKTFAGFCNESFEVWLLLYFQELTAPLDRKEYLESLTSIINTYAKRPYQSKELKKGKHIQAIITILKEHGDLSAAIERAKKMEAAYTQSEYHLHNPSTSIHGLVEKLRKHM